jgi:hypothetical protein
MPLVLPCDRFTALVKRPLMAVAVSCLGFFCGAAALVGQVSREYDVKAVFLLNFAQFVEWPPESFSEDHTPFTIGILGEDPFKRSMDSVVRNETVRNRPVVVQRYRQIEEVQSCQILFVCASEERALPQILNQLRGRPILTVSDIDRFADRGGMIALYLADQKVRLRINHQAARAANLTISSKLLRVADVISSEPGP